MMLLSEKLKTKHLILASGSPRRQKFFTDLGLDFSIKLKPIEEVYPSTLKHFEITDYLAELKAKSFIKDLKENDILITSDTIVWHNNKALGKPKDENDAFNMLTSLRGQTHEVITSICITSKHKRKTAHAVTKVTFGLITDNAIKFYIKNYKPFDKAGAYGIQEWIGLVGVTNIEGSYNNVVGLPTHLLYDFLNTF